MKNIVNRFLPFAVVISAFCLLAYLTAQQVYRQGANDPQIQMAEDAADALADGQSAQAIVPAAKISVSKSLAPFLIVYDADGQEVASSVVLLDGQTPGLPAGVLDATRSMGENRVTWQPRAGVRIAAVIVAYKDGFVLAGRSLREAESRVARAGQLTGLAWALTMAAALVVIALGEWLLKDTR